MEFIFTVLMVCILPKATAQLSSLAITEVMTSASNNHGNEKVTQGPDFWELTNFGSNRVILTGYSWCDNGHDRSMSPFFGLTIQPGESIIFFNRINSFDATQFRQWWGPKLPAKTQIIPYGKSPGLSSFQEQIRLFDSKGQLVDCVQMGLAQHGVSFTYDPNTGIFGVLSVAGTNGAFSAHTADDVGSPGITIGSVAPVFVEHPVNQEAIGFQDVEFHAYATGKPAPQYQWWFNGEPLAGAVFPSLTNQNVQLSNMGNYWVVAQNLCSMVTSGVARLTVRIDAHSPVIEQGLQDAYVYAGQSTSFNIQAKGYPEMSYQWYSNNVALTEASGNRLLVSAISLQDSGAVFSVVVSNALGIAKSTAHLFASPVPRLHITEVMPKSSTNFSNFGREWFEVTNLGSHEVPLKGWMFFDAPSLNMPCVVTQAVTLKPGQSAVFAQNTCYESFCSWWGKSNLPPDLIIIPYGGFKLRESGETLFLWCPGTTDPYNYISSIEFYQALSGISMNFTTNDYRPHDSKTGVGGAFKAEASDDIGSPGYCPQAPPRILDIRKEEGTIALKCQGVTDRIHRIYYKDDLSCSAAWISLGDIRVPERFINFRDTTSSNQKQRYYRLEVFP